MLNYDLTRIAFGIFLAICTLVIPLGATVIPLVSIIRLARLQQVRESIWLLLVITVVSAVIGMLTTVLAMAICGGTMAFGKSGEEPSCNFGPLIFLPIGILFTALAFGTGLYFIGELVVRRVNESARDDWY